MECPVCKKIIPYGAATCNYCFRDTKIIAEKTRMPDCDMYGQPVFEVYTDKQKVEAREKNINSMHLSSKIQELNTEKPKINYKQRIIGTMILIIPYIFVIIAIIANWVEVMNIFREGIFILAFILLMWGFIITILLLVMKRWWDMETEDIKEERRIINFEIDDNLIHKNKEGYYYNQNVIGFSILDVFYDEKVFDSKLIEDRYMEYYYFEIDKKWITNIDYDTKYSEYILTLTEKVFMNYNMAPAYEFRIPDVFDDTELSIALGLDLPAKYMEF